MAKKTATKPAKKAETSETEDIQPGKIKKEVEFELPETLAADKIEEADAFEEISEDEEASEDGGLDEEEINPFNDKWEE